MGNAYRPKRDFDGSVGNLPYFEAGNCRFCMDLALLVGDLSYFGVRVYRFAVFVGNFPCFVAKICRSAVRFVLLVGDLSYFAANLAEFFCFCFLRSFYL